MSETMTELKPCPFCGSPHVADRYVRDGQQVFCTDCGASAPPAFHGPNGDTEERATNAWNRRAPAPTDVGDDLVGRLRTTPWKYGDQIERQAANRIEQQAATITTLRERVATLTHEVESAGALRLRMEAHKETVRRAEAKIEALKKALTECESIAKQAEIFATGRRPSLDPTERWIMIQDTARTAIGE